MSLKAKLEAVIYAAEEPVTLTQLAALFTAEAFEWKAEQDAAAASAVAAAEAALETPNPLPHLSEGLEYLGLEDTPAVYAEHAPEAGAPETDPAPAPDLVESVPQGQAAESAAPDSSPSSEAALEDESDARRLARQRDREVKAILRQILDELIQSNAADDRGVEIREIAGGYRMATKPECHDAVRMFIKSLKPAMKLSLPALETLAVIAYKQPVTAPEVNEIRGVDSSGVFGSLLARKLITTAGRKQVIGRPILYKTTKEFLLRFGLKDVAELPSMEEFEKMAAIELEETTTDAETEEPGGPGPGGGPELDENATEEEASDDTIIAATPESERAEEVSEEVAPAEPPPSSEQAETETPHHD
jgi:segregation and condensation protein B